MSEQFPKAPCLHSSCFFQVNIFLFVYLFLQLNDPVFSSLVYGAREAGKEKEGGSDAGTVAAATARRR